MCRFAHVRFRPAVNHVRYSNDQHARNDPGVCSASNWALAITLRARRVPPRPDFGQQRHDLVLARSIEPPRGLA